MHNAMGEKVIRAKILFFDSNPVGRITSRFSIDTGMVDGMLAVFTMMATSGLLRALFVCVSVVVVNPWSAIIMALSLVYMIYVYKTGTPSMVGAQRLIQKFQSPINQSFTTTVNGLVTFRAYRKFHFMREELLDSIELSGNATFVF